MTKSLLPEWNLSEFYSGLDDPKIESDINKTSDLIQSFTNKYKGKISSEDCTPTLLSEAFRDYKEIIELSYDYGVYASLLHSKNSNDEKIGAFYQRVNEIGAKHSADILWFSLERKQWSEKKAQEMLSSQELEGFHHFLKLERLLVPYVLSEKEERLLDLFSPVGSEAFVRFYDELNSGIEYRLEVDGEEKVLNSSEIGKILSFHPDRKTREKAAKVLTEQFENNKLPYTFVLNTLLLDSKISDEIRGFQYPQHATFLSYEVEPKTVESLVSAVTNRYSVVERFYKAKAKILKLDILHEWDRYTPVYFSKDKKFTWEEAKETVLSAFYEFDETFANTAKKFFDEGWIDANISKGKRSGAFCMGGLPTRHPFILLNFAGEFNDVLTLAHELGHGVHSYLSRNQSFLEHDSSTAIAEIASIFSESLVFDYLQKDISSEEVRINLLAERLQGSFATVFRQIAFYVFESEVHNHRRELGELTTQEFNNYYQGNLQKMFGNGLELTEGHKYWWGQISHFYHFNFYVFTYAFGELLTNSLYSRYKKEGKAFVSSYLNALSLGGSKNPYEITKEMGVDINKTELWEEGLDLLESYVQEFEDFVQ